MNSFTKHISIKDVCVRVSVLYVHVSLTICIVHFFFILGILGVNFCATAIKCVLGLWKIINILWSYNSGLFCIQVLLLNRDYFQAQKMNHKLV